MLSHTHVHTGKDLQGPPVLSHTHMYTWVRTWRGSLCCHTHTCTHEQGPGVTACVVTNTHVHTGEDQEGPPVLSYPHMYTQVRTWRDCLCCTYTCTHGQGPGGTAYVVIPTHVHTGEDREGPLVLPHTDMYTRGWVSCFVTHSALCDETFHSHVRLGNHDTGSHPSHHFLALNKLKSCNQTVLSTVLSLPRL